jgi:uncharacterized protein YecE (DUF72 family)
MIKKGGQVRVGPAGWSYPDWEGVVYPARKGRGFDPLAYLARYFDTIEINSTFYRPPYPKNSFKWAERIAHNEDFRFTVKLYRKFTHERDELTPAEEKQWKKGMEPLIEAGRLGAILVQFPYSFHYTEENLDYLSDLRGKFPDSPLVLEIRHRSWNRKETFDFLKDIKIGFCNIDQPRLSYSQAPSSRVTSAVAYIRLHGRNVRDWFRKSAGRDERYNYLYSLPELQEWSERIKAVAKQAREVYVIANNHYRGQAVCNSLQLKSGWEKRPVPVPPAMLTLYPQLQEVKSN